MRLDRTLSLLVVGVISGCTAADDSAPAAQVVDSAGVRILTYDLTNRVVPTYRSVGEHDLEVGMLDGPPEYTFSRIVDVAVGDDGSILISDAASTDIRVYDAAGLYLRSLGGPGEGPGEFGLAPSIAQVNGDTTFAFDARNRRVTMLDAMGNLVGELSLRSDGIGRLNYAIRLDDGSYVVRSPYDNPNAPPAPEGLRLVVDSIVVMRLDPTGSLIDTLRVLPGQSWAREESTDGQIFRMTRAPVPYSANSFVLHDGARPFIARGDRFELTWFGSSGRPTEIIRVLGAESPADHGDLQAHHMADLRERYADEPIPPATLRLNTDFIPDRLPAFGSVVIGEDGDLWVSRAQLDASAGIEWLVFSPAGELRGSVHTPPDVQVFRITDDYFVGVVLDDLEVPFVRRYPLVEPTPIE